MKRRLLMLAAALALAHAASLAQTLVLAVNAASPLRSLSQKDALALYTGRIRSLPGVDSLTPLDQDHDGPVRAAFYQALTGQDIARINSYWARLHFTGQVHPPQAVGGDAAMLRRLRADAGAIGYLSSEPTDAGLRVLLRLP